MKRKKASASTGHGTGAQQALPLRVRLRLFRERKALKLSLREARRNRSVPPAGRRDDRGRSMSAHRAAAADRNVAEFDMGWAWKKWLKKHMLAKPSGGARPGERWAWE